MKKSLLITWCILSWFVLWLILALILYIVVNIIYDAHVYTFYECMFYEFVLGSQFVMGWVPAMLIWDEYKAKVLTVKT